MKAKMFLLALEIRSKAAGAQAVAIGHESNGGGMQPGEKPALAWAVDFLNRLPADPNDRRKILFFYAAREPQAPEPTKLARSLFWREIRTSGLWGEGVPMVCRAEQG